MWIPKFLIKKICLIIVWSFFFPFFCLKNENWIYILFFLVSVNFENYSLNITWDSRAFYFQRFAFLRGIVATSLRSDKKKNQYEFHFMNQDEFSTFISLVNKYLLNSGIAGKCSVTPWRLIKTRDWMKIQAKCFFLYLFFCK